ncbi:hypothetical protein [Aliidiomarina haloalkalitolerans]|uniref:Uncharacterized protein n=1 Tax=Aliidiomarina haloalkalitolerans TaxID=859059 RepID=A0A432VP92_9GAMM|nr:hypothetical protein [Aliidiomarina haloalkalitolerans]RUO17967.1 hypothetical protein CWE06_12360 [Aliidiomarina haloalkalitolerans]
MILKRFVFLCCKFLLMFTFFVAAVGCDSPKLPAGERAGGFGLNDESSRAALEIMKTEQIAYEIKEVNGSKFVFYLLDDKSRVLGILRKSRYGDELNPYIWESMPISTPEYLKAYRAAFEEMGIRYDLEERYGIVYFRWSQINGPQVDVLRQRVEQELSPTPPRFRN